MPAIKAIITGDASQLKSELDALEAAAKRTGATFKKSIEMEGAGVNSGVMRELVVLGREIGRGNWSRVPGSLSILLSRLGLLKYLFTATAGVIIAAGVATYYFYKSLVQLNEALDNTGKNLKEQIGDMRKSIQEASRDAARAYADQIDWMRKLGQEHDTLKDKADDQIRVLREEMQLRREASADQSPGARLRDEQELRKAEAKILDEKITAQQKIFADSVKQENKDSDANSGPEGIRRKAILKDLPKQMADAKKEQEQQTAVQDALKEALTSRAEKFRGVKFDDLPEDEQKRRSGTQIEVEVAGKKYVESLDDAANRVKQSIALQATLDAKQDRLENLNEQIADALKDSKAKTKTEQSALDGMVKERNKIVEDIALHDKYDEQIEARELAGKRGQIGKGSVSSLQQVGAYTTGAVDIAREQLRVQKEIERNTRNGGSGTGGVKF